MPFHTEEFISSGIPIVPPSWYYVIADQKPSTILVKAAMAALNYIESHLEGF